MRVGGGVCACVIRIRMRIRIKVSMVEKISLQKVGKEKRRDEDGSTVCGRCDKISNLRNSQ